MATATIKAGTGINVGCDFTRLMVPTPIEYDPRKQYRANEITGTIAGDMNSPRGFMRRARVECTVQRRFIEQE